MLLLLDPIFSVASNRPPGLQQANFLAWCCLHPELSLRTQGIDPKLLEPMFQKLRPGLVTNLDKPLLPNHEIAATLRAIGREHGRKLALKGLTYELRLREDGQSLDIVVGPRWVADIVHGLNQVFEDPEDTKSQLLTANENGYGILEFRSSHASGASPGPGQASFELGPVDIQPSVTKLVHFPPPEAKFSSNRSTIPQKIPLQEEKNVLRLARNAKCPQALEQVRYIKMASGMVQPVQLSDQETNQYNSLSDRELLEQHQLGRTLQVTLCAAPEVWSGLLLKVQEGLRNHDFDQDPAAIFDLTPHFQNSQKVRFIAMSAAYFFNELRIDDKGDVVPVEPAPAKSESKSWFKKAASAVGGVFKKNTGPETLESGVRVQHYVMAQSVLPSLLFETPGVLVELLKEGPEHLNLGLRLLWERNAHGESISAKDLVATPFRENETLFILVILPQARHSPEAMAVIMAALPTPRFFALELSPPEFGGACLAEVRPGQRMNLGNCPPDLDHFIAAVLRQCFS